MSLEIQIDFLAELCGLVYDDELTKEEGEESEVRDDRFITF